MRTRISATGKSAAYTLIEILVVIGILAVTAGLIAPRMKGSLETHELKMTTANLAHTAGTLHELAMAQQKVYFLEIDSDKGAWAVSVQSDQKSGQPKHVQTSWLKSERWPKSVRLVEFRTPEGETTTNGMQRIKFSPDGTSSGGEARFKCGSKTSCLVVHPHNGRTVYGNGGEAFYPDQSDLGD
ncbi:MAG: type II secretion system protein [Phycisphaerae bacterium]